MKRTFIAVKVSEETKQLMPGIVAKFPELRQKIKIANPDNPHITLKFLGDTKESDIPKIHDVLVDVLQDFEGFSFETLATGCFPNKHKPKVLWLGINKGLKKLQALHNLVENTLHPLGYEVDNRDFVPHLTLGRVKRDVKIIDALEEFLDYRYNPIDNAVEEVVWFDSLLTPHGAVHSPLRKYKLK